MARPRRRPASRAEPALKPNQPTHSSAAPTQVRVTLCGVIGSWRIAEALAEHQGADQGGDARVDVHHRAAGEVEGAPLEDEAGIGLHGGERLFGLGLGRPAAASATFLAASARASGPAQYQTICAIGK